MPASTFLRRFGILFGFVAVPAAAGLAQTPAAPTPTARPAPALETATFALG